MSEIKEFLSCPARHYFRYRLGLWSSGTTAFFALGNGVHAGLERWYYPNDPHNREEAFRQFRKRLADESRQVDWGQAKKGEDPLSLRDRGERLLGAAVDYVDDWVPMQVETNLYADITHSRLGKLPVPLKIKPDMVLTTRDFVDHKTADKTWEEGRERSEMQPTGYTMAGRQNFGHDPVTHFNVLVDNAQAKVFRRTATRTQDDIDRFYGYARLLLEADEAKTIVYPNPTSWAHKTCDFRRICDGFDGSLEWDLPTGRALQALVPKLSDRVARVDDERPRTLPTAEGAWDPLEDPPGEAA